MCSLNNIKLEINTEQESDDAEEFKVDIYEHNLNYTTILGINKSEHVEEKNSRDIMNYSILEDIKSEHFEEKCATNKLDLDYDYRECIVKPEPVQFNSNELNSTSGKCNLRNSQVKSDSVKREYSSLENARHDDLNDQHYPYQYGDQLNTEIKSSTYYKERYVLLESIECELSKLSHTRGDNGQATKTTSSATSLGKFYKMKKTEKCDLGRNEQVCEHSNSAKTSVEEDSGHLTDEYEDSNLSTSLEDSGPRNFIHLSLSDFGTNNTEHSQRPVDDLIFCEAQMRERHLAHPKGKHQRENIKMYQCQRCDYRTEQKSRLSSHFNGIHAKDPKIYTCQFCTMKTKYKGHLVRHFTLKHDPLAKWYHCYQCEYRTKDRGHLIEHIRNVHRKMDLSHTSEFDTKDEQKENLIGGQRENLIGCITRIHRNDGDDMTHSNKAEIDQHEFYNHRTKYKNNLMEHVQFSTSHIKDLEIFECQFCSLKFKYKKNLTRHVKVKHDPLAKWYDCYHCEFRTKDKGNMIKHIRVIHTRDLKLYKCQFCELKTKHKLSLMRHFTRKHDPLAKRKLDTTHQKNP